MKKILLITVVFLACTCCRLTPSTVYAFSNVDAITFVDNDDVLISKIVKSYSDPKHGSIVSETLGVLIILDFVAVIILFVLLFKRTSIDRIKKVVFDSHMFSDELSSLKEQMHGAIKNTKYHKDIDRLKGEVEELNKIVAEIEKSVVMSSKVNSDVQITASQCKDSLASSKGIYTKNFRAGIMNECSEYEAQFKLSLKTEDSATFEFCGDLESAKLNFDGTFDGVCDTEGSIIDATNIKTVIPGKVTKCDDGWKVCSKSTVRFE